MAGGGRRLNVLVTRARDEVHLVTSIPPESYRSRWREAALEELLRRDSSPEDARGDPRVVET